MSFETYINVSEWILCMNVNVPGLTREPNIYVYALIPNYMDPNTVHKKIWVKFNDMVKCQMFSEAFFSLVG